LINQRMVYYSKINFCPSKSYQKSRHLYTSYKNHYQIKVRIKIKISKTQNSLSEQSRADHETTDGIRKKIK
jgi:hypothetical protein